MAFKGQFTYGIPVTAINIVDALPDNAVIPATVIDSKKGNVLGITVGDFKSSIVPTFTNCNIKLGEDALSSITTGENNIGIGCNALRDNTYGTANIAVGNNALPVNTGGSYNVAIGDLVLRLNITGSRNVGIGRDVLYFNTTGSQNIAIGETALFRNTTANNNVAIGLNTLFNTTTGGSNIAIGFDSLRSNTTGTSNTAIGEATASGNFNSSVIIGREATATASNQFVVGSSSYNAGAIATEPLTPTKSWTVRINGVNYKIALQIA
jgi:hypothetical protein